MSDESRHRVRRGRPLRTVTAEQRRQANARRSSGRASRARAQTPKTEIDWDLAIVRLKAMLDAMDYGE
jgi:hypothetical protein